MMTNRPRAIGSVLLAGALLRSDADARSNPRSDARSAISERPEGDPDTAGRGGGMTGLGGRGALLLIKPGAGIGAVFGGPGSFLCAAALLSSELGVPCSAGNPAEASGAAAGVSGTLGDSRASLGREASPRDAPQNLQNAADASHMPRQRAHMRTSAPSTAALPDAAPWEGVSGFAFSSTAGKARGVPMASMGIGAIGAPVSAASAGRSGGAGASTEGRA
ncbi:MAG TPA: hypothetical protein VNO21_14105, partial [Polyangiaceae bacterium]|nr:hypothetical protein [Polyangiaceae bacterium]